MTVKEAKIKLGELQRISASLEKLLTCDLQVKIAYRLSKMAKIAMKELKTVEDTRMGLIKKLGTKDEKGNINITETDKREEFVKSMEELMEEEVTISFIPLDLNVLGDKVQLSAIDIANLETFIDEKSELLLEDIKEPGMEKVLEMKDHAGR